MVRVKMSSDFKVLRKYALQFNVNLVSDYRYRDHTCFVSCINIFRVGRKLFEHEDVKLSVQTSPRDPANVNAMKQTCVILILAYLPDSNQKPTENTAKTLEYHFRTLDFS